MVFMVIFMVSDPRSMSSRRARKGARSADNPPMRTHSPNRESSPLIYLTISLECAHIAYISMSAGARHFSNGAVRGCNDTVIGFSPKPRRRYCFNVCKTLYGSSYIYIKLKTDRKNVIIFLRAAAFSLTWGISTLLDGVPPPMLDLVPIVPFVLLANLPLLPLVSPIIFPLPSLAMAREAAGGKGENFGLCFVLERREYF